MRALIFATLLLSSALALAHDSRPAYLELVETDAAVFELSWKRPLFGGRPPTMEMALPTAKETGGVVGKYKNVSITLLSFYASWH